MKWLEIAWQEQGTKEIEGAAASPAVLAYFIDVGRSDISSDEVSWCAAFVGACLARAGIPITIPTDERLLARSYLDVGIKIDQPRIGCVAVLKRGKEPWQGHVGFVVGMTKTHLALLGGNQANEVCVRHYDRSKVIGYRWPAVRATIEDLQQAGSRTVVKANAVRRDGLSAGALVAGGEALPTPDPAALADKARTAKGLVDSFADFGIYVWDKWPWIAAGLAIYYMMRLIWNAGWISWLRLDDHNSGANTGRVRSEQSEVIDDSFG